MPAYVEKRIWGRPQLRHWTSVIFAVVLFGYCFLTFVLLLRRLDEDNQGFEYAIPLLFFIILGLMIYSIYIIRKTNKIYVILGENHIIYNDRKVERKIFFKDIKVLKSEQILNILGGFIFLFFMRRYQIYLHDGKTEIYIKEDYFTTSDLKYIFAWLAEHSIECDFGVQDRAKYLQKVKKSDLMLFKSTPMVPVDRSKIIKRQSAAISIFIIIVILIAVIFGAIFDRGAVVQIKELSYPEESTTLQINVTITLENRGDHTAHKKDIEVEIDGASVETLKFEWHEDIKPQKTSTVTKQVNLEYDPFPGSTVSHYTIYATLYYKGEESDHEF
ncbi:MAG: hypothetical protein KAJ51_05895 [Thermoplasmata archaeon]|nr:hypothetical protein [Thermoplasmata archaeon]